jgi:hypothetical protein
MRDKSSQLRNPASGQRFDSKRGPWPTLVTVAGWAENWLSSHLDFVVLFTVALGFLVRAAVANNTFLNPDEALHLWSASQPTLKAVYRASITNAHPPLYFLALHCWQLLGNSELFLRLPSVLAGAAFPWIVFKWLGEELDKCAALFALIALEFSPTMIVLSAELRGYALFLFFASSALYFLGRAFRRNCLLSICAFTISLYLAIGTEYCGLWFTLALGAYALLCLLSEPLQKSVAVAWAASQIGALAIYAFLYLMQISALRGSAIEHEAMSSWLKSSYFQFGRDRLPLYILENTVNIFQYAFSNDGIGAAVFSLFLLGIGFLVAKNRQNMKPGSSSRRFAMLLLLPFVIGMAAGIARLYPYGGSRHNIYLALFGVAGAGALSGILRGKKLWPGVLAAMLVIGIASVHPEPIEGILLQNQSRFLMDQAVKAIHQTIPPATPIFVEAQTSFTLRYYLCRGQAFPPPEDSQRLLELDCGGYRLISPNSTLWIFPKDFFPAGLDATAAAAGLPTGEHVWVVHAGWNPKQAGRELHLHAELAKDFPELRVLPHRDFGANICLFQTVIGGEQPRRPHRTQD